MKVKKVLIATDGSERSEVAAEYGISLAKACGADLNIISVSDSGHPRSALDIDPDGLEEIKEESGLTPEAKKLEDKKTDPEWQFVSRVSEMAHKQDLKVSCEVRVGNPADEIVAYASANDIDLIVLGAHGRSAMGAALMGSITTDVIHKTKTPVLVIPVHES